MDGSISWVGGGGWTFLWVSEGGGVSGGIFCVAVGGLG